MCLLFNFLDLDTMYNIAHDIVYLTGVASEGSSLELCFVALYSAFVFDEQFVPQLVHAVSQVGHRAGQQTQSHSDFVVVAAS